MSESNAESVLSQITFGLEQSDFKSPEEALEYYQLMIASNKRKDQQLRTLLVEQDYLKALLDRDNRMVELGVTHLNFPNLEDC